MEEEEPKLDFADDYVYGEFVKYRKGNARVEFDCYHGRFPKGEYGINEISEFISEFSDCPSIISLVSREVADLNRKVNDQNKEALFEYRVALESNFSENSDRGKKKYLLIVLHGMRNREEKDIEIGTRHGEICSKEISDWFVKSMNEKFDGYKIVVDEEFKGSPILKHHRFGNEHFDGLGENFNVIQVEMSTDLRDFYKPLIVKNFIAIAKEFEEKF